MTQDVMKTGDLVILAAITLAGFVVRAYGLGTLPFSGDDITTALSATNYMHNGNLGPTMWHHPLLRSIAVYASMSLLGDGAWGLKSVSMLLGTLTVLFTGLLAYRLTLRREAAFLAALFLAIDPIHIDFSRQAVQEIYMGFFSVAGVWFACRFRESGRPAWLAISGVLFGLGIASKWDVGVPLVITALFLCGEQLLRPGMAGIADRTAKGVFILSMLTLLPAAVYALTFIPWFAHGYGFDDWFHLHGAMLHEALTHTGNNPYLMELDHRPALWFLKPVGFADIIFSGGQPLPVIGIANPLVWLLTLPSLLYLGVRAWKTRDYYLASPGVLFIAVYLPFALARRPIAAHSACSVLPYAFMMAAFTLVTVTDGMRRGRVILGAYLLVTVLVASPLYLLATGRGEQLSALRPLINSFRPLQER